MSSQNSVDVPITYASISSFQVSARTPTISSFGRPNAPLRVIDPQQDLDRFPASTPASEESKHIIDPSK